MMKLIRLFKRKNKYLVIINFKTNSYLKCTTLNNRSSFNQEASNRVASSKSEEVANLDNKEVAKIVSLLQPHAIHNRQWAEPLHFLIFMKLILDKWVVLQTLDKTFQIKRKGLHLLLLKTCPFKDRISTYSILTVDKMAVLLM